MAAAGPGRALRIVRFDPYQRLSVGRRNAGAGSLRGVMRLWSSQGRPTVRIVDPETRMENHGDEDLAKSGCRGNVGLSWHRPAMNGGDVPRAARHSRPGLR